MFVLQIFRIDSLPELLRDMKLGQTTRGLTDFVDKVVFYVCMMKVQQPEMVLHWQKPGTDCDKTLFSVYTKAGQTAELTVWPAVLLHKSGPLMCKGIVKVK